MWICLSWLSLKLASIQICSNGTIAISGVPAAMRWPTCTERLETKPVIGADTFTREKFR